MKETKVDRVAKILNMRPAEIRIVMGQLKETVPIASISEAKERYLASDNKDEEASIMMSWIAMCTTAEEIKEAVDSCYDSCIESYIGIQKWISIAKNVSDLLPLLSEELPSDDRERLMSRIAVFLEDPNEVASIYDIVEEGNKAEENLILKTWLELCAKKNDFNSVINYFNLDVLYHGRQGKRTKKQAKKVKAFIAETITERLKTVKDFDEAKIIFSFALDHTPEEKDAFAAWLSFCTNQQQIEEIMDVCPDYLMVDMAISVIKKTYEVVK